MGNRGILDHRTIKTILLVGLWISIGLAYADPVVTNVTANQRTGETGTVDIYYDLTGGVGLMNVTVALSSDNGAHWDVIPTVDSLRGDVGPGISNGTGKHIIWNAGKDHPDIHWTQARAKVIAAESCQASVILLPGDVPLEMVMVPGGTFTMGSALDELWNNVNEGPPHSVTIAEPFYMGKYEVTQAQWMAVMGTTPSHFSGDANPVESVSWNDCRDFLEELNGLGKGTFRLPSEAEWEYACRAGSTSFWYVQPWHDFETLGRAAWFSFNSLSATHPVGLKLPNAFGLHDMIGNVWEWCHDWYHLTYEGAPANGSAWLSPTGSYRVLRGAGWEANNIFCRSAYRLFSLPGNRLNYVGLRLVWMP
jgi:formylglycine-generating enzyme required for sulfatase activity